MSSTGTLPNPGYMLPYGNSPEEAIQIIEDLGYTVSGFAVVFPVPSESGY